jgi:hypothetical protein
MNMNSVIRLLLVCCFSAITAGAGVFSQKVGTGALSLKFKGEKLIANDSLSYLSGKSWDDYQINNRIDKAGWRVINVTGIEPEWSFRREICIAPNGKEIELTVQVVQKAYSKIKDNIIEYVIKVPLKVLKGAKFDALTGRSSVTKEVTGVINFAKPNAGLPTAQCRWLSFSTAHGNVVFDFNPEGVISYSDWGPTLIRGQWAVRVKKGFLEFVLRQGVGIAGTTVNSKLTIFEGSYDDFLARHSQRRYHYFQNFPAVKSFSFGSLRPGKRFSRVKNRPFNIKKQSGWLGDVSTIRLGQVANLGPFFSFAESNKPNTFQCLVKHPALYLFTLSVATGKQSIGTFGISSDKRILAKDQEVPPNTLRTFTWAQWVDNGKFTLNFFGNWRISALSMQMLQQKTEDYKVRRSFWRVAGLYEPSTLYRSAYFTGEPEYKVSVADLVIPSVAISDAMLSTTKHEKQVLLPNQRDKRLSWRFRSMIGSLGTLVTGSFDEFNTPELIKRRVAELKARKINAITVDGLHSRLLFAEQLPKIEKNMKMLVKECHRNGIKVIDHYSLTLLWNWGNGMRFLVEHPGWLQRSINGNLPSRGICPNNPGFRKFYFDFVKKFIIKTDIDGMMIDEVGFQNYSTCGCTYCRSGFTRDTGLVLPLDKSSPLLSNINSNFYKSFLSWRAKSIGDFYVDMRREIKKVKPMFTLLNYTTNRLFYQREVFFKNGISITETARGCDWLGVEIMTRNVMASYRTVFAFGKLINSLREAYGSPIFRLVYTNNYDMAYFSWAMNAMLSQTTWYLSPIPTSNKGDFTNFSGAMDNFNSQPRPVVAVLFSTQSRDWGTRFSPAVDTNGFLENLGDRHIPSIALIEASLTKDKLKKIPVLILPSASCMDDKQIQSVMEYARNGGRLVISATTAIYNKDGIPRNEWPFAKIFGFSPKKTHNKLKVATLIGPNGKSAVAPVGMNFVFLENVNRFKGRTILQLKDSLGKTLPAGFVVNHGKGEIIYLSGQLGTANFERYEQRVGYPWTFKSNADLAQVMDGLLKEIVKGREFFWMEQSPERLISTVYEEKNDKEKTTIIHLLNVSGIKFKRGEIVSNRPPVPAFPKLGDVTFSILAPEVKRITLMSPDFSGEKVLSSERCKGNKIKITIPSGTFQSYAIVRIQQ